MATINGTISSDVLFGTDGDDLIFPNGVGANEAPDRMSGGNGADTYDLREPVGEDPQHRYVIDDNGTDGAEDTIAHAGKLIQTASLGYQGFTSALRDGDDLIIVTPGKPHRFRDPAKPSHEVTIVDHFAGEQVEWFDAGGTSHFLPIGGLGTAGADLMAGSNHPDTLKARAGNDYMIGNRGADSMFGGTGDDVMLGGNGADHMRGQSGNDFIYGGNGRDNVRGGSGHDFLYLEDGNDKGYGGQGNDFIFGQDGNDTLVGNAGQDMMSGGNGNDRMLGGRGGDTYRYSYDVDNLGSNSPSGHDVIVDNGDTPRYDNFDRIELFGYYGPRSGDPAEAFARLAFVRDGDDMVMISDDGQGSITVANQFAAGQHQIEELHFNAGYWTPMRFKILDGAVSDIGDDRSYFNREGGEWNEILFGTAGADTVFGNSGTNFIWLGDGADVLIYKEADPELLHGNGGGSCNDIVEDFDIAEDVMDFTEIEGVSLGSLTIADNARGNATVNWDSGTWEIADINIELRDVTAAELTSDHFVFL